MKSEKLFDGITDINEELISDAEKYVFKKGSARKIWLSAVAAVLVLTLIAGVILIPDRNPKFISSEPVDSTVTPLSNLHSDYAITEAKYPVMAQYPVYEKYFDSSTGEYNNDEYDRDFNEWWESRHNQLSQAVGFEEAPKAFFEKSLPAFLSGSKTENKIYSPLNIYMALSMLAEITDGNSRSQILSLLDADSIDDLRTQASALWNGSYIDDGSRKTLLSNSVWLSDSLEYNADTMKTLADKYYTSSYKGVMGSDEYNKALQSWLNEQTGGLLEKQASEIGFDPETVLALASTVYFKSSWHDKFDEALTKEDIFHCPGINDERNETNDIVCDFMNTISHTQYYWGDNFGAVRLPMAESSGMWLILPDEGYTPDDLLSDTTVSDLISNKNSWENSKYIDVNISVPKFDVSSDTELRDILCGLGVSDVFDPAVSDFSPMMDSTDGFFVDTAKHAARVMIDEEGCSAAAFTVLMVDCTGALVDSEKIDFVLDRPFIFVITNDADLPLFAGVVNKPI